MKEKNSFVVYHEWAEWLGDFSLEEKGFLLDCLFAYSISGETVNLLGDTIIHKDNKRLANRLYKIMTSTIKKDTQKYLETCRKNSENGKKSAEARKKTVANDHQQPLTTVSDHQQPLTSLTDNDNDYDYEYDNDYDKEYDSENESVREETKLSQKITKETIKGIDSSHILNDNDIKYICEHIKDSHMDNYVPYVVEYIQKKK